MRIESYLDKKSFFRFSVFDTFQRRKMWRSPVIFTSILTVCACICFLMHHVSGAIMLGTVLLLVGLGMSLSYFLLFFHSLRVQIKQLGLYVPKLFYSLELSPKADGIHIDNGKEQADYQWKQVHHVYRDKDATYLFITPQRAFILPHDYVQGDIDELWAFLQKKLSSDRCSVLR